MNVYRRLFLLIACFLFIGVQTVSAQEQNAFVPAEDWDWGNGSLNAFTGEVDLSAFSGQALTLKLEAEFVPAPAEGEATSPVFAVVNGSRITILRQSDTLTLEEDRDPILTFTANLRIPENGRCSRIRLRLIIQDTAGQTLNTLSREISRGGVGSGENSGAYTVPFEIRSVALILGGAAAVVWALALFRHFSAKKRPVNRQRESSET